MNLRTSTWFLLGVAALALALPLAAQQHPTPARTRAPRPETPAVAAGPRVAEEKSGSLATREGLRLRLVTDLGNLRIRTLQAGTATPQVIYRVRVESVPGQPEAERFVRQFKVSARSGTDGVSIQGQAPWRNFRGRLWVNFELEIPRNYNVEVSTQAGNIQLDDLAGRVSLLSSGGNLTAGHVGGSARLETQGGHITVQDVAGELVATTAGGHITAGNVGGSAVLESSGGHIRVGSIQGTAQIETGGGNIFVERAGSRVTVATVGGRIDIGQASGAIQARTGGGGIRVLNVSGPMEIESAGGGIFLNQIQGPVRALTAAGGITARFAAEGKLLGTSRLECRQGDLIVFLPRRIPMTIEATIEEPGEHRIDADPDLQLNVRQLDAGTGPRSLRAEGNLNGGGEVLRLHTVSGNIKLRFSDASQSVIERVLKQQLEQLERQREMQLKMLERQLQIQLERHVREVERLQNQAEEQPVPRAREGPARFFERLFARVRVPADEQNRRLVHIVHPAYPELARAARIEGRVRLQVVVGRDGTVEDVKVLSGHSLLTQAAVDAIRQWRYEPFLVNEKPVLVVTSVDVDFRLN